MSCRPEQGNKTEHVRKPDWLKIKLNTNENYTGLKKMMREKNLNTVCEEARCPNIHECWGERRTATFMILGAVCTRACRFCAVKTGLPTELDTCRTGTRCRFCCTYEFKACGCNSGCT